jgi:hypothetical protein
MRMERSEPILPSRDLPGTRAFYRRLGFTCWFDGRGGWDYEIVSRGHLVVHFFLNSSLDQARSDAGCYLRVVDADRLHGEWSALGLPVEGIPRMSAPRDEPWGMREFTIVDPSGNLLRIGHDLDAEHAYSPREPA